jgi:hypothetical protein
MRSAVGAAGRHRPNPPAAEGYARLSGDSAVLPDATLRAGAGWTSDAAPILSRVANGDKGYADRRVAAAVGVERTGRARYAVTATQTVSCRLVDFARRLESIVRRV